MVSEPDWNVIMAPESSAAIFAAVTAVPSIRVPSLYWKLPDVPIEPPANLSPGNA